MVVARKKGKGDKLMYKILCLSTVDFDWMYQRPQQLMMEFSRRGWSVIYCNKTQREELYLEEIDINITICHNLKGLLKKGCSVDLVWAINPQYAGLKGIFNEKVFVYDYVDDFPFLILHHHRMVKVADVIIATSTPLLNTVKRYSKNAHLIPNGCDYQFFNASQNLKSDYHKNEKVKTIGYIGAIAPWVDLELIELVAQNFPQEEILLIGATLGGVKVPKIENIRHLGHQIYEKIPSYLNEMDVVLIPFKRNQITRATNPIKLYEYLSMGKPIVSTYLPELLPFNQYIYMSNNKEEFIESLSMALREDDPKLVEKRKDIAQQNSWQDRVNSIIEVLLKYL